MDVLNLADSIPEALIQISNIDGNSTCVDCGAADNDWASLGFAVLVCIECAGHHRSLGTHITSIRSISMDMWSEDQIMKLAIGGNNKFKAFVSNYSEINLSNITEKYTSPRLLYYRYVLIHFLIHIY
jgi:ADP-ribosylation factor GTPase-activating protein 1